MSERARYLWPEGRTSAACVSVDVDAEAPWLWAHRDGLPPALGQLEQRRFGPREGLWRLVETLERFGFRGSFFVPGIVAATHPEILPALVGRGHEVGLHGWLHEIAADSDQSEFERALDRSIALFERQIGRRPAGFRSPAWEMTPAMLEALAVRGLGYDSSLSGFDHPYEIDGVTEIPVQWTIDDAVYFRFFGGGVDRWPPQPVEGVLASWREEWRVGRRYGALFMVTLHPWISGRAQRIGMLERLLAEIAAEPEVWRASAGEIAAHHAGSANAGRFAVASDPPRPERA